MTGTPATGSRTDTWVVMADGTRLAVTLYLPAREGQHPVLLEALPYRKDDLTSGYRPEYELLRDEHGFAVCRVDLRGTGSSEGIATDEYPVQEQDDLVEVVAWLADQPWSNGNVGMFGTSWSGFNAIQVAMRRPPALKAIAASYATDDRWTDDVHYYGGALRLLDQVDYPLYMLAMNALPPVPAVHGDGWRDEWRRRLEGTVPWQLRWLTEQRRDPYWRHGSLRPGYEAVTAATLLIVGWADGYRNNSFRTAEALRRNGTPVHVLAGPWAHQAPVSGQPGPRVDHVRVLADWFGTWLRPGAEPVTGLGFGPQDPELTLFVRRWAPPEPDADTWAGEWRAESVATLAARTHPVVRPLASGTVRPAQYGSDVDGLQRVAHDPDLGLTAWNSCAGSQPWGLPADQRREDDRALCVDLPVVEAVTLIGHPRVRLRIVPEAPLGQVAVRLCAVDPATGTSVLVSRGLLALAYRDGLTGEAPLRSTPVAPGVPLEVEVELEATSFALEPGAVLRVALATTEWPNAVAPPGPQGYAVDLAASSVTLPVVVGASPFLEPLLPAPPPGAVGQGDSADDADGTDVAVDSHHVRWWYEEDVLARTTTARVDHGASYAAPHHARCVEHYVGAVSVDRRTWDQAAVAATTFEIAWPQGRVRTEARLDLRVTDDAFDVALELDVDERDGAVHERLRWSRRIPRDLA